MIAVSIRNLRKRGLRPKPKLNVVEWADKYRYLPPESSSKSGRWKTSTVEVARGVMLAYTDPKVNRIVVMSCTQLLKTELINNLVGYHIDLDPIPMGVLQPTETLAQAWSKDRLMAMARCTPVLQGKMRGTVLHKTFDDGLLPILGSNSAANLAMRPLKSVFCDEIDKYPLSANNEGDPITLIAERQAVFWDRKLVLVCSPTDKETSRIYYEYQNSDKRLYFVDCVHCGHNQDLVWEQVKWEEDSPETALYYCKNCNKSWTESQRKAAISKGSWRATAEFSGTAGFHVSKMYSLWESMAEIAIKFVKAKNNIEMMKAFKNTQLAQVWENNKNVMDWQKLYNRREMYPIGTIPKGAHVLTAGADVQKDRVEIEVVAWGRGLESWSVDYIVIKKSLDEESTFNEMLGLLDKEFDSSSKYKFKIEKFAIDSGYNTQRVYDLVNRNPRKFMAVKGMAGASKPIISPPSYLEVSKKQGRARGGVALWAIGTHTAKDEIFSRLNAKEEVNEDTGEISYPIGYCHFPNYKRSYFMMLCSEVLVTETDKNGYQKYYWRKTRKRNEALDCRVYNRAAAATLGVDKFPDKKWKKIERITKNK